MEPDEPDAGVDAVDEPDAAIEPTAACTCVAVGGDGSLTRVELPSMSHRGDLPAVATDASLRAFAQTIYAVNPQQNNVAIIDLSSNDLSGRLETGLGTNPRDIAVVGSRAYIPLMDSAELQIWNLGDSSPQPGVPLSNFEGDGNPDAASVVVAGGAVYVSFAYLDASGNPVARGAVFSMSSPAEQFERLADLSAGTPVARLVAMDDSAMVSTSQFGAPELGCGIDVIDRGEFTSSCLATNMELGGVVTAIEPVGDASYVIIDEQSGTQTLARIGNPLTIEPLAVAESPVALAHCEPTGHLVYTDAASGALHVINLDDGSAAGAAIAIPGGPTTAGGLVCAEW